MSRTLELTIEERTFVQLERLAEERSSSVEEMASQTIRVSLEQDAHKKMQREIVAYRAMHPQLRETHLGQHVALFQGQLVDSDQEFLALFLRIQKRYPDEVVLMREVRPEADPVYRILSPRLERG